MLNILVTGGPVPANLDAVKIITNKFKGRLIVHLAETLAADPSCQVTYLTYAGSPVPDETNNLTVVTHNGFDDYRLKVRELGQGKHAIVLGAAVANLIPANPWKGKFPSHDYKPGDIIPIEFTIAPRIVDEIKSYCPKAQVFAFKLLSGVPEEELVRAAYETLLGGKASAVFANDATKLGDVIAVTKERALHPMSRAGIAEFIKARLADQFYASAMDSSADFSDKERRTIAAAVAGELAVHPEFFPAHEGLVFGTIALRQGDGFLTTARGKNEMADFAKVIRVSHDTREVICAGRKATLNAPLLDAIFKANPRVYRMVHGHVQLPELPTQGYATPGSVEEVTRALPVSFNMDKHGCYLLFDAQGEVL